MFEIDAMWGKTVMQTRSIGNASERIFAIVLDTGDVFPDKLIEFAKDKNLFGGFFNAIGAFSRATLGFFDLETKEYKHNVFDEQVEVASLIGNIGVFDDKPKIHAHAVIGRRDGSACAGHLIEGVVRPTLEIFVYDSNMRLTREMDAETGLRLIRFLSSEGA